MKNTILFSILMVLFCAPLAQAYSDGDFQIWNTDTQEYKINKDFKVSLDEEFRWGGDAREFFYQHYDLGLSYKLSKYWSVGGGYRQAYELRKGKFKPENQPYITATLSLSAAGIIFESRNRFEYRNFCYKADSGRYRNKFTLKYPLKIAKFEVKPFLSDEIFFGFGGTNKFNQNRFSSGFGFDIIENIKAEIYYMLVTSESSKRWIDSNVLGIKFKIIL